MVNNCPGQEEVNRIEDKLSFSKRFMPSKQSRGMTSMQKERPMVVEQFNDNRAESPPMNDNMNGDMSFSQNNGRHHQYSANGGNYMNNQSPSQPRYPQNQQDLDIDDIQDLSEIDNRPYSPSQFKNTKDNYNNSNLENS